MRGTRTCHRQPAQTLSTPALRRSAPARGSRPNLSAKLFGLDPDAQSAGAPTSAGCSACATSCSASACARATPPRGACGGRSASPATSPTPRRGYLAGRNGCAAEARRRRWSRGTAVRGRRPRRGRARRRDLETARCRRERRVPSGARARAAELPSARRLEALLARSCSSRLRAARPLVSIAASKCASAARCAPHAASASAIAQSRRSPASSRLVVPSIIRLPQRRCELDVVRDPLSDRPRREPSAYAPAGARGNCDFVEVSSARAASIEPLAQPVRLGEAVRDALAQAAAASGGGPSRATPTSCARRRGRTARPTRTAAGRCRR